MLLHFLLQLHKNLQVFFQEGAHHALHGLAVEADELRQHFVAEHRRAAAFFFQNDLQQYATSNVIVGFGIHNLDVHIVQYQLLYIAQRDIGTGCSIVQTTVRVLLDHPFFYAHETLSQLICFVVCRHITINATA